MIAAIFPCSALELSTLTRFFQPGRSRARLSGKVPPVLFGRPDPKTVENGIYRLLQPLLKRMAASEVTLHSDDHPADQWAPRRLEREGPAVSLEERGAKRVGGELWATGDNGGVRSASDNPLLEGCALRGWRRPGATMNRFVGFTALRRIRRLGRHGACPVLLLPRPRSRFVGTQPASLQV